MGFSVLERLLKMAGFRVYVVPLPELRCAQERHLSHARVPVSDT